jgi:TonB-linked SusC/RagA family outer membrane protein
MNVATGTRYIYILSLFLLGAVPTAWAQTGAIEGTVTDAQNGEPLPGVNVVVTDLAGEGVGAATGPNGQYRIDDVPAGSYTLEARFVGYRTQEQSVTVSANDVVTADFAMRGSSIELDEVVVSVAAGDTRRKEVGTDIATVSPRQLEDAVASNLSELLNGRAENVTITQASGNVGGGSRIRVRGITSLTQDNNPLLVIDGVRVSNSTEVGINRGQTFSRFDDINPDDIASIQVVKGPAATALYGSEAAPGVIIIETKTGRGTPGGLGVTFQSELSVFNDVEDYPDNLADVTQFGITDPGDSRLSGWRTDQNPVTGEVYVRDNPFEDESTSPFRTGFNSDNTVSVRGTEGTFNYYTSLGYQTSEGVLPSNDQEKWNFRANFQGNPSEYINVSANAAYVSGVTNLPKSGGNTSGFFVNAQDGQPLSSIGTNGECLATVLDGSDPSFCDKNGNVRAGFDKIEPIISKEDLERFNTSLRVNVTPFSWMINTVKLGADVVNQTFQDAIPFDPDIPFSFAAGGENFITRNQTRNFTADLSSQVSYGLTNDLSAQTSIGAQYFQDRVESVACEGRVFPNDQATACDAAVNLRGFSDLLEKVEIGAYLQHRFNFRDYFFVTGAMRVDDNSALGENEDAIWSPSVNTSAVLSEMPFWSVDEVSNLRLRFAWGRASQAPRQFSADRTFVITRLGQGGQIVPGLSPQDPGNPDLGPERSEEFEFGLNAGFLDDRVGLSATYFTQSVTDAIISRPVAPSTGFPNDQFVNIGELKNQGIELSLDASIVDRESVAWDARLGFSTNDSEITDLGLDNPVFFGFSQILEEGISPGAYVSRVITSAERDADGNIIPESIEYAPGTLGDGSGRRVVGQPFPKNSQSLWTSLTLLQSFRITTLFERKGGFELYSDAQEDRNPGALTGLTSSFGEKWAFRQTQSTPVEQAMMEQNRLLGNHAGVFMHEGNFVKWRELRVTYTVPRDVASRYLRTTRAQIYIGGRNLATWTDYPGLDPELNERGARDNLVVVEDNVLPPPRTFFGGVSLSF